MAYRKVLEEGKFKYVNIAVYHLLYRLSTANKKDIGLDDHELEDLGQLIAKLLPKTGA